MSQKEFATQIWPFREYFGQDMPGTLERIAKMGFAGVELCRWFNWTDMFDKWSSEDIQTVCQRIGLKVVSSHVSYPTIFEENLSELIQFCHTVEMRYAIVAAVPEEQANTRKAVLGVADVFNTAAEILKAEGIRVGYHNHGFDFKPLAEDGSLPWELFFDNTNPEVVMQVDIGNALKGGADPIHYLKKYPKRARLVHLKEYSAYKPLAAIGDGEVDWNEVIEACEEFHQPEWYIIEQEEKEYDPWVSAETSLAYLRKMGL
jgi:sugar phosphate isomerase/epimerase